jgi:hypothetical protein
MQYCTCEVELNCTGYRCLARVPEDYVLREVEGELPELCAVRLVSAARLRNDRLLDGSRHLRTQSRVRLARVQSSKKLVPDSIPRFVTKEVLGPELRGGDYWRRPGAGTGL